ncbi:unnamed protein product [Amoebophrya sp. A120]|nr:unnamed protein product [Amoebophrya sp. A120]|eukprot:GSA120T00012782001.1
MANMFDFQELVPDEFTAEQPELRPMLTVRVRAQDGSRIMKALPPLATEVMHLKRIRKVEQTSSSSTSKIESHLEVLIGAPVVVRAAEGQISRATSSRTNVAPSSRSSLTGTTTTIGPVAGEAEASDVVAIIGNAAWEKVQPLVSAIQLVQVPARPAYTAEQVRVWGGFWPVTYRRPANLPEGIASEAERRYEAVLEWFEGDPRLECVFLLPHQEEPNDLGEPENTDSFAAKRRKTDVEPRSAQEPSFAAATDENVRNFLWFGGAKAEGATSAASSSAKVMQEPDEREGSEREIRFPAVVLDVPPKESAVAPRPAQTPATAAPENNKRTNPYRVFQIYQNDKTKSHPLKSHAVVRACDAIGRSLGHVQRSTTSGEQYLCVNAEVFLRREPCVMCAMALIHSRVSTVVFQQKDRSFGGFGGALSLHREGKLNHQVKIVLASKRKNERTVQGDKAASKTVVTAN